MWISILLDCSCIGSMAMPRVWFFGMVCLALLSLCLFFVGPLWFLLYTSCILSLFFLSIYCSLSIKKNTIF